MTAMAVIPRASRGCCPRLIAKEVTIPAPKAAVTAPPSQSFLESLSYIVEIGIRLIKCDFMSSI